MNKQLFNEVMKKYPSITPGTPDNGNMPMIGDMRVVEVLTYLTMYPMETITAIYPFLSEEVIKEAVNYTRDIMEYGVLLAHNHITMDVVLDDVAMEVEAMEDDS